MTSSRTDRWAALDFAPPAPDVGEAEAPVLLDYLSDGRVARITLNRPHADNAITTDMGALLTETVEEIAVRTAVRVVVLTGAGDRAFSVGSDLRQRKAMTKEDWLRQRQAFDRTLYTVRQLRKPIFTAVNGIAYGGGCELAQSTDFIIASTSATFGQPEAMLGLAAGGGSPALLPRLLPRGKALQMLMTGDPVPAQEARKQCRRAAAGCQAEHRFGLAEGCVGRGDDEVGALGQLAAASVGEPVDGGEERLAQLTHRVQGAVERLALAQPVLLGHGLALPQVAPDGERSVTGTGQDDDPDLGPHCDLLDDLGQQCAHVGGDRVVRMRSIQGDPGDPPLGEVVQEHGRLRVLDVGRRRAEVECCPSIGT